MTYQKLEATSPASTEDATLTYLNAIAKAAERYEQSTNGADTSSNTARAIADGGEAMEDHDNSVAQAFYAIRQCPAALGYANIPKTHLIRLKRLAHNMD